MCHLLLLPPVLALPVFWFWPLQIALPVYGVAAATSLGVYALVFWAWRAPRAHGPLTLLGASGDVVRIDGRRALLRVRGELWLADVRGDPLVPGDVAQVVGIDGLRLTAVRQPGTALQQGAPPPA